MYGVCILPSHSVTDLAVFRLRIQSFCFFSPFSPSPMCEMLGCFTKVACRCFWKDPFCPIPRQILRSLTKIARGRCNGGHAAPTSDHLTSSLEHGQEALFHPSVGQPEHDVSCGTGKTKKEKSWPSRQCGLQASPRLRRIVCPGKREGRSIVPAEPGPTPDSVSRNPLLRNIWASWLSRVYA